LSHEGKRYFSKLFHNKNERTVFECICIEMKLLRKDFCLLVKKLCCLCSLNREYVWLTLLLFRQKRYIILLCDG
jgi:uncharacterized membrane protein